MSQVKPSPATLPLRTAMEARDVAAVVDAFAPGAVFRSPLTGRLTFTGPGQIGPLTQVLLSDVFDDFRYTDEVCGDGTGFLVWRARVGGQDIEGVDHLRFSADGKIAEMTVFFRPLPAAAAALRLIGAGLARHKGPGRAVVISNLARPLAAMARVGDAIGARLIRSFL